MKKTVILIAFIIFSIFLILDLCRSTNCGGNYNSLGLCTVFSMEIQKVLKTHPNFTIQEAVKVSEIWKYKSFRSQAEDFWVFSPTKLLNSCNEPIIICAKKYDNVPQPRIWSLYKTNPSYAIAKLGQTSYLISPEEYKLVDKKKYVKAVQLFNEKE